MKISELLSFEDDIWIDASIDINKELRIERKASEADENSLFFLYAKADGSEKPLIPSFEYKKPYAIVCGEDIDDCTEIPLIRVKNVRRALAFSYNSEAKIDYSDLKIIGITGTNGKSSTAEMIFRILVENGEKVGFIGTGIIKINENVLSDTYYSMTTPDPEILYPTLKQMKLEGCKYIVMEVSSHSLALTKVAPIKFKVCIFTNLSKEHSDFHSNMEEYYKCKLSLFNQAEVGIFNVDDTYSRRAYQEVKCKKHSVGIIRKADAYIVDYRSFGIKGCSYYYKENGLIFKTSLNLAGAHNVYNSLIATKCALVLAIPAKTVKTALGNIKCIKGRYEVISGEISVVIDYAHTPLALENILKSLKSNKSSGQKLFLVFGCGGDRDKSKRPVMGKIAAKYADFVFLTEDNSRSESTSQIINDIADGISNKDIYTVIEDRKEAIRSAIFSANDGDVVAIVGKGHEKYIIDENGAHYFNEAETVNTALIERRKKNENKA